jgi:hypothetical protein
MMSDTVRGPIFIIIGELFVAMFGFLEARRGARTFWIVAGVLLLPTLTALFTAIAPYFFGITAALLPGWLFGGLLAYLVNKLPARPI